MDGFGTYYMSLTINIPGSAIVYATIPNAVYVIVNDEYGQPIAGVNVHACINSVSFDPIQTTNSEGVALFALPNSKFRFFAEVQGIKYWSGEDNHCDVPYCDSVEINVK